MYTKNVVFTFYKLKTIITILYYAYFIKYIAHRRYIGTVKIIHGSKILKKKIWLLMTVNKLIIANIINKSYIRVLKYLTFRQQ